MALSQKHSGLILVPWFNSQEWHYVYHLVYSNNKEQQMKALDLLKIWKLRTPILSTGVEGTLILLDALLTDTSNLTDAQISSLYSIAVMRFLNLSAANSNRQGSFTRTSTKNELPKWIINIRHNIAHGLKVPTLHNLKLALDFGIGWLKEKYWEPQSQVIKDFSVADDIDDSNPQLSKLLKFYIELNVAVYQKRELKNDYIRTISHIIYKRTKKNIDQPSYMLEVLLQIIMQSFEKGNKISPKDCDLIVSEGCLLMLNMETAKEIEKLAENFQNIWWPLLNILNKHGLLFKIIEKLLDIVLKATEASSDLRLVAALWINDLFESIKCLEKATDEKTSRFESCNFDYAKEIKDFQTRIMDNLNEYTAYFMESALTYKCNDDSLYRNALKLLEVKLNSTKSYCMSDKIYGPEDLNLSEFTLEDLANTERISTKAANGKIIAENKWKIIESKILLLGYLENDDGFLKLLTQFGIKFIYKHWP